MALNVYHEALKKLPQHSGAHASPAQFGLALSTQALQTARTPQVK